MSKDGYMQNLLADGKKPQTAAEKIPILARGAVSDRAKETLNLVSYSSCKLEEITLIKGSRSKDSSKKNASRQTQSSTPKWAKAKRDGTHGLQ